MEEWMEGWIFHVVSETSNTNRTHPFATMNNLYPVNQISQKWKDQQTTSFSLWAVMVFGKGMSTIHSQWSPEFGIRENFIITPFLSSGIFLILSLPRKPMRKLAVIIWLSYSLSLFDQKHYSFHISYICKSWYSHISLYLHISLFSQI